ncbi:DNA mismatch repair protein spellchecker 1 [Episyrphus balteatus]|uniref:DNA mismatch repair protein spellchecker 1 n=1 Tax=Episyrphus balteatus TaxID=286459 RepID=UPI002486A297|nr:DNA mismatch repair protein spellchecker 1 [Episyrphus balteatus]
MDGLKPNHSLNLDINAQRNFMKFYAKLGEKPPTTVRFFDRTEYYSIHGVDDTDLVSRIFYKTTAHIQTMSPDGDESDKLPYLTLSKNHFENVIRDLLLVKNYRVEVYTKKANSSDWKIEFRGSPGNLIQFEDLLFANKEVLVGNTIISLQIRMEGAQKKIGLVSVEQNDCLFLVTEFVDDDFFTELEATVVLLGPKECLLPKIDGEYAAIKTLMERNGVMVSQSKKYSGDKSDLIQDLNKLLRFAKGQQEDASTFTEIHMELAMDSLRAAINYLSLVSDPGNLGHYELKTLNLNRYVHLDAAAVSALNILPKPGTQISSPSFRWQSILGVLDQCRTAQGHRLMAQWVKQPLRSKEVLNDRHDVVQCLTESPTAMSSIHEDYLKRIPDILMLTKKLMRKKASIQDLFRIYQVILRAPRLISTLLALENNTVTNVICEPMKSTLGDLAGLKQMVEQVVDLEIVENGEYMVKASFDENLAEMKEKMDKLLEKMNKLLTKASQDLEIDKGQFVKLESVSHLGYHFRIALKDDSVLRKSKSYKVLDVIRGGVRFTSDKLTAYSQAFGEIREQYEEEQKSIVEEVIKVAKGYSAPLTSLNNQIAQLDCLVSFAVAAHNAPTPYVRPKMLDEGSGELTLKDVRHPCLELQENVTFISNDVEFKKDDCNMFIITGPNMGGKSTYIRSVGTAVLMAHVGSFVPCSQATISMVDSILGRVGASDNIIKGLSTFMVEMIETSGIIRTATEKSLVIIDELGRGTSTYEGCGIAWSIAEHLAKETKCFTLFATHFHEITNLAETCSTVRNCHMAALADDENFTLLFQVRAGVMQKSFGIQVARLANFPDSVVKMAQNVYHEFEDENVQKRTQKDEELINKIETAIDNLSSGNNVDINEGDLTKLVEQFKKDIQELDSEYFKAVLSTASD